MPLGLSVSFSMQVETQWGDTAILVGSTSELGSWDPARGVRMRTDSSTYPWWHAQVQLHSELEYKVVVLRGSGAVEWEGLQHNRILALNFRGHAKHIHIHGRWNDPHTERKEGTVEAVVEASLTPLTADMMDDPHAIAFQHRPPLSAPAAVKACAVVQATTQQAVPEMAGTACFQQRAPPPNRSFTVIGAGGAPPNAAPCSYAQPPAFVLPLNLSGSRGAPFGQTLSPIESLDMSWPPSCASSFKSTRSHGPGSDSTGSLSRNRSCGSFVRAPGSVDSHLDEQSSGECAHSVLGSAGMCTR